MRHIVIGDVHGMLSELKNLWNKTHPTSQDQVIFLGDLIDKGPHSNEVVTFVREKKEAGFDIILIMGNHEDTHLRTHHKLKKDMHPSKAEKLKSKLEFESDEKNIEFLNKGLHFYKFKSGDKQFVAVHGGIHPAYQEQYGGLPKHHDEVAKLVVKLNELVATRDKLRQDKQQPDFKEKETKLNVTIKPLKKQLDRLSKVYRVRFVDEKGQMVQLGKELPHHLYWADAYDHSEGTAFYGHQPYYDGVKEHKDNNGNTKAYGLDTGAVFGGHLTAAIVEDGEVHTVSEKAAKAYAKPFEPKSAAMRKYCGYCGNKN
jgi:serine/threonine protein phosphatase 1